MTPALSQNALAILLLTAPLIAGRASPSPDLLSPGEYKRLARHLRDMQRQPGDLLSPDVADLLSNCARLVEEGRLRRLLGRGFLLSQAVERWQTRAIWVASRADRNYPRRLKALLRDDAPAVIYGCGDSDLLDVGGLAVVGSRNADDELIDYATNVGRLAAKAGKAVISGAAKGIDQASMLGALDTGGNAIGVLADSLEKTAMNRENRDRLVNGQLVLISPYDPSAGFNVGNAMQRNKLIYALADAALVVSTDFNKGGTWAGATEQLDKLRMVPVYARSTPESSAGIDALRKKGAIAWPDPDDASSFNAVFAALPMPNGGRAATSLFSDEETSVPAAGAPEVPGDLTVVSKVEEDSTPLAEIVGDSPAVPEPEGVSRRQPGMKESPPENVYVGARATNGAADALYATVRELLLDLLVDPMKDAEVAEKLQILPKQARTWLQRLVDEGVLDKKKKPSGYVVRRRLL
jgi:DNA processing protein